MTVLTRQMNRGFYSGQCFVLDRGVAISNTAECKIACTGENIALIACDDVELTQDTTDDATLRVLVDGELILFDDIRRIKPAKRGDKLVFSDPRSK